MGEAIVTENIVLEENGSLHERTFEKSVNIMYGSAGTVTDCWFKADVTISGSENEEKLYDRRFWGNHVEGTLHVGSHFDIRDNRVGFPKC